MRDWPAAIRRTLAEIRRRRVFRVVAVYLLVAWPGLCRAYVYRALRRMIDADPEARRQLDEARGRSAGV